MIRTLAVSVAFVTLATLAGCAADESTDGSSEADITQASSAFTSLEEKDCQNLPAEGGPEMPIGRQLCSGMGGFDFLVEDGDERMNVQVKHGDKTMDLSVWSKLPAFSHLGPKADWRGTVVAPGKVDPYALIFRYFQTDGEGKETNFLVVSRVTKDASCIIDVVPGSEPNHNEKAHRIADENRNMQCPAGPPKQATSIFTKLEQDGGCTFKSLGEEDGVPLGSEAECPGTDGYTIHVDEGDLREGVTVVHGNTKSELFPVGGPLSGAFNRLGPTADWRVNGPDKKVHALIFRFFESEPDGVTEHSFLLVSKVTPEKSCLVDIIDARKHTDANVLAHVSADKAFEQGCPAQTPKPR